MVVQIDDTESGLVENTYRGGVLINSMPVGPPGIEAVTAQPYKIFLGATLLRSFNVRVNIFGPGEGLSDTAQLFGMAGNNFLTYSFVSTDDVLPWRNPTLTLRENGDWQTFGLFNVSNGDHYTWQFRSDVERVPDAGSSLVMMFLSLASLAGMASRSRKSRA